MEKKCKKCGSLKPLNAFYRHHQTADRLLNICKECTIQRVRLYRLANLESIRAHDRQRKDNPKHRRKVKQTYQKIVSTPEGRSRLNALSRRWATKNRLKKAAHVITWIAIRGGKVIPQDCEHCGIKTGIQAHHEDYNYPLQITWLCKKCHGKRHREINQERRNNRA